MAIGAGFFGYRQWRHRSVDAAWETLRYRPILGRISGLPYHAPAPAQAMEDSALRRAALEVADEWPRDPHRAGVALLLAGRTEEAVRELDRCAHSERLSAPCWTDLAAAQIELARHRDGPQRGALAFAAADRAVQIEPRSPEGLFNRAAALETLRLDGPAAVAWKRYLDVDAHSPWAAEARQRIASLTRPTRAQEWPDALKSLAAASKRNDSETMRRIVSDYRYLARATCELYVLNDWANAVQNHDAAAAAAQLKLARDVGAALIDINGERLLADAVAAIDRARGAGLQLLAEAHIAYRKGRSYNKARVPAAALPWFQESAEKFRRAGSPMARMADYYIANCQTDLGKVDAALASIHAQLAEAPPGYRALRGYLLWQQGTAFGKTDRLYEVLDSYQASLSISEEMQENVDYMASGVATAMAMVGRYGESWRRRVRAFAEISRNGDSRALQAALETTARAEATARQWEIAGAFYGLSLEPELKPENPALLASASIWRALMSYRLGWTKTAREDIARARQTLRTLKDREIHETGARRLMFAEALIVREQEPERAIAMLNWVEDRARQHQEAFDLREILLERGRIYRSTGREDDAVADFRKALALSRERDRGVDDVQLRNSYFAADEAAAEELIDILDRRNDRDQLLLVADQSRARTFPRAVATDVRSLTSGIPHGTVLAHFTSLPDRLLVIRINERGADLRRVNIPRPELRQRIAQLTRQITEGDDEAAHHSAGDLYGLLLGTMDRDLDTAQRLVVVPDEVVAGVPFAALIRPNGRFLIESCAIVHAPSALFFSSLLRDPRPRPPLSGIVTVGHPQLDMRLWPDLPELVQSEREARDVRALYQQGLCLIGAQATRERVLAGLAEYPVADLACHAVVDPQDQARSLLLLAPAGEDHGTLYLRDVAALTLRNYLIVLAACKSSAPAEGAGAAMRSFAFAFLAAGAHNAIGALWDVDDGTTRALSTTVHSQLRRNRTTTEALRLAQLSMLRSGDRTRHALRSWSGFQLYGAGN